jgi:hypothetical protein
MRIWGTKGQLRVKIGKIGECEGNRNTLGNVREIGFLNKIKMVISCANWGECDKCVGE